MKKAFTILLLISTCNGLLAQLSPVVNNPGTLNFSEERLKRIDGVIETYINDQQLPGAVVLIVRNGKIAYHKAFGYRNVEKKIPLKKDDIFRIASQSKAITSLAAMMLWEEGKFLLDDPVSKYIPEFANPKILKEFNASDSSYTTEKAKGEITIRQLFTHTSGLDYAAIGSKEFRAIYAKAGVPSGIGTDTDVLANKIKLLGTLPLKHNPGERYTYSLSTDVLGHLVEIWSGMPLDQFLKKRIFEPLGMNDTYFYLPREKHDRLVTLYGYEDGKIAPITGKIYDGADPDYPKRNGTYFSGGAGLSSTAEDYAKFLQLFLNKGVWNGKRLISRKTIELMLTDHIPPTVNPGNEFGLGFGLETAENDYRTPLSLGSFTWSGAFNSHYWADPQENLVAVILTNVYQAPFNRKVREEFRTLTYQAIND